VENTVPAEEVTEQVPNPIDPEIEMHEEIAAQPDEPELKNEPNEH
jgi:hypothetical protein